MELDGSSWHDFFVAAVTLKKPTRASFFVDVVGPDGDEAPEALAGDVGTLLDLLIEASAAFILAVYETACADLNLSATIAFATPNDASTFFRTERLDSDKTSEALA